jgi:tRNA nucleotidyltransferase (CCA-adding enzyme)
MMMNPEDLNHFEVGGSVRDEQLGRKPNDRDILVVGHTARDMEAAGFEQVVGEAFPVFLHPETGDEWALARQERSTGDSPQDFHATATADITLEEDLVRRDLTINAMAKDPETGKIFDPHNGLQDIEDQVLRHVSEAFVEDPHRVIRLATFAARLPEFTVHDGTIEICKDIRDKLPELAPKRVYREMKKCFRKAEEPRRFFEVLDTVDALEVILPEVADLKKVPAGPEFAHKEGSAFEHTLQVIEQAHTQRPNDVRLLMAALAHDLGKTQTDSEDLPNHPDHTKTGLDVVDSLDDRIKLTNEHRRIMRDAVRNHMKMHQFDRMNASTIIRFVDRHTNEKASSLLIDELIDLAIADSKGRVPQSDVNKELINTKVQTANEVINTIDGNFVMNKFDVPPEKGEKIGDLITQERVRLFREKLE